MFPLLNHLRSRRSGVTLVEIVIAIFILTVGVLSIFSLFPTGYQLTRSAFDSSVSALAARDAQVRIRAEFLRDSNLRFPKFIDSKLSKVPEPERIGTVTYVITDSKIHCLPSTGETSAEWTALANHYIVFTSGACRGRLFKITGSGSEPRAAGEAADPADRNFVTCATDTFREYNDTVGAPVSVGDHFAIIGSTSDAGGIPRLREFPRAETESKIGGVVLAHAAFTGTSTTERRTIPIAHQGKAASPADWEYSYGVIISDPSAEMEGIYRADIFIYRGFSNDDTLDDQSAPVGHFTTYLSGLDLP
jgi:hypothetical protein